MTEHNNSNDAAGQDTECPECGGTGELIIRRKHGKKGRGTIRRPRGVETITCRACRGTGSTRTRPT